MACISAMAVENPFELNANVKKIEQDQDVLLGELKEVALKQEATAEEERIKKVKEDQERIEEERAKLEEQEKLALAKLDAQKKKREEEELAELKFKEERLEREFVEQEAKNALAEKEAAVKAAKEQEAAAKKDALDVNIEREGQEAAEKSEEEYINAVAEMDKED